MCSSNSWLLKERDENMDMAVMQSLLGMIMQAELGLTHVVQSCEILQNKIQLAMQQGISKVGLNHVLSALVVVLLCILIFTKQ